MTEISLIAAMDEVGGIGLRNKLLCHLPADLSHFKGITLGKPIVMGRRTFESIGKPLPGRVNIVLSRRLLAIEGVLVVDSIEKVLSHTISFPEIMIIGGAELYIQTIEMATRLYITCIHHQFEADVFFPEINEKIWGCCHREFWQRDEKNEYDMTYYIYERSMK